MKNIRLELFIFLSQHIIFSSIICDIINNNCMGNNEIFNSINIISINNDKNNYH
jgi:hypothetical protein